MFEEVLRFEMHVLTTTPRELDSSDDLSIPLVSRFVAGNLQ